jgi:hypothetical protein
MRKVFIYISVIILAVALMASCSKNGTVVQPTTLDCSTVTNKDFTADVNPIIQSFCNQQGCHDVASINGPGPLTNYSQVFNARSAVRSAIQSGLMPQNTTLSTAQKNSILCWIDGGAPNN